MKMLQKNLKILQIGGFFIILLFSFRERFTYFSIFISIETIYIEGFYFCTIDSFVIAYYFICTTIILCLSLCLSCKITTVEISFSLFWNSTWPHELDSIFCVRYTRFLDISSFPELSEIEIIVNRFDSYGCEEENPETNSKSFFNHSCDIQENNHCNEKYHKPDASRLGCSYFFKIFWSFHRKIVKIINQRILLSSTWFHLYSVLRILLLLPYLCFWELPAYFLLLLRYLSFHHHQHQFPWVPELLLWDS